MGSGRFVLLIDDAAYFDVCVRDIARIEAAVSAREEFVEFTCRRGPQRVRITGKEVAWSENRADHE